LMRPMSSWPNKACELMPSSSNMADHIVGRGTHAMRSPDLAGAGASALRQRAAAVR
jgi:hypothetical protein